MGPAHKLLSAYRLGLRRAVYSCKVRPSPCATAFVGFLLPTRPQHGFWRWCRQGTQESYGRPSWTHCTLSETWPILFDCTIGRFQTWHNCSLYNSNRSYTDKAILNHLGDTQMTIFSQSFFLQIRASSIVIYVLKTLAGLLGTFRFNTWEVLQ